MEKLCTYFLNAPKETVQQTLKATTEFGTGFISSSTIRNTHHSPFPACNVLRRNEPVTTDTLHRNCPAVDCGHSHAQYFVGKKSCVQDIYPVKTECQFVNALEDIIRERGAMKMLITDGAKAEISNRVLDILRAYHIQSWRS